MAVRAKFQVNEITLYGNMASTKAKLGAVTPGPDATDEDRAFWSATPSGTIEINVTNPSAAEFFEAGKKYYVTFERAPVES